MGKKADALKEELASTHSMAEALESSLEKALGLLSKAARTKWDATANDDVVRMFTKEES